MSGSDIFELVKQFRISLMRTSPLLSLSLANIHVEYVDEDHPAVVVTNGKSIKVYRNAVSDVKFFAKAMLRAVIHHILSHPQRGAKLIKEFGIGKDNEYLKSLVRFAAGVVAVRMVPKRLNLSDYDSDFLKQMLGEDYQKLSMEQIFMKLLDVHDMNLVAIVTRVGNKDKSIDFSEVEGMTVAELEKEIKRNNDKLVQTYVMVGSVKSAGKEEVDELRRYIEELLKEPPLRWDRILRRYLQGWERRHFISTWERVHRKSDDIPGVKVILRPRIIVCVDVSGSISDEEYTSFCREILGMTRFAEIHFITWDVKSAYHGVVKDLNSFDRASSDVTGRGGTNLSSIMPLLSSLKPRIGFGDLLIVLSDGGWTEESEEVEKMMKSLKCPKLLVLSYDGSYDRVAGFEKVIKIQRGER